MFKFQKGGDISNGIHFLLIHHEISVSWVVCAREQYTGYLWMAHDSQTKAWLFVSSVLHISRFICTQKRRTLCLLPSWGYKVFRPYLSWYHKSCLKNWCQLPKSLLENFVDEAKLSLLDLLQQESMSLKVNNISE